jgi:hypothetical protein
MGITADTTGRAHVPRRGAFLHGSQTFSSSTAAVDLCMRVKRPTSIGKTQRTGRLVETMGSMSTSAATSTSRWITTSSCRGTHIIVLGEKAGPLVGGCRMSRTHRQCGFWRLAVSHSSIIFVHFLVKRGRDSAGLCG